MVDFEINLTAYGGELRVKYPAGENLYQAYSVSDVEATRSFEKLKQDLPRYRKLLHLEPRAPAYLAKLELPEQNIGDRGTRALVEALLFGSVRVAEVYLYKCLLGDAGAQALSYLMEHSPAPGITGLHLSHNYFSPIGVKLMIDAARRCKMYPIDTVTPKGKRVKSPLWLRVDNQYIPWPGYDVSNDTERLRITEKRVEELNALLLKKSQGDGSIPDAMMPWERPRLICIPAPKNDDRLIDPSVEDGMEERWEHSECTKYRCKFASEYGPLVHLPFFWMQGKRARRWTAGRPEEQPEAAALNLREANWKSWFPRVPRPRVPAIEMPKQPTLENGASSKRTPAIDMLKQPSLENRASSKGESSAVTKAVQEPEQSPDKAVLPLAADKKEKLPKEKKTKKDKTDKKEKKKAKKEKRLELDLDASISQARHLDLDASVGQELSIASQVAREAEDLFGSDEDEIDANARPSATGSNAKRRRTTAALPLAPEGQLAVDGVPAAKEEEAEEFEEVEVDEEEAPPETDEELEFVD